MTMDMLDKEKLRLKKKLKAGRIKIEKALAELTLIINSIGV